MDGLIFMQTVVFMDTEFTPKLNDLFEAVFINKLLRSEKLFFKNLLFRVHTHQHIDYVLSFNSPNIIYFISYISVSFSLLLDVKTDERRLT